MDWSCNVLCRWDGGYLDHTVEPLLTKLQVWRLHLFPAVEICRILRLCLASSLRYFPNSYLLHASSLLNLRTLALCSSSRQRSLLPQSVFTEVIQLYYAGLTLYTH